MYCTWILHFGDYCFTTDCGHYQGRDVRPRQRVCLCGNKIKKFIEDPNGVLREVKSVSVSKNHVYFNF